MIRSQQCIVSGKVQGVSYRMWTFDQASTLGLKGWVRNLADGKVEALLQGDESAMDEIKKRMLQGPPLARVDDLQCKWLDYDTEHETFEIRT